MPIKMIKPSGEIVDVAEEHFDQAKAKGLEGVLPYVKPSGESVFVKRSLVSEAERKGLKPQAVFDTEKSTPDPQVGSLESAARGFANSASFGFVDEVVGAGRGLANTFSGYGGDSGFLDRLKGNYQSERDAYRLVDDAAWDQNPSAYFAGGALPVAAQIAAPIRGATKAAGFASKLGRSATGAVGGATSAAGGGTDRQTDVDFTRQGIGEAGGELAQDVALGALMGGSLPVLSDTVGSGAGKVWDKGKQFAGGFKRGVVDTNPSVDITGVRDVQKILGGLKEGMQTSRQAAETGGELAEVMQKLNIRPMQGDSLSAIGSGKDLLPPSTQGGPDSAFFEALLSPGKNAAKDYVASKSATYAPGNITTDQVSGFLDLGADRISAAANFNPEAAANQLLPGMQKARNLLKRGTGDVYERLHGQAEAGYGGQGFEDALGVVRSGLESVRAQKSAPGAARQALAAAEEAMAGGRAAPAFKLSGVRIDESEIPAAELYRRLQAGRESVDGALVAARNSGDKATISYLKPVRESLDAALKSAPEKQMADAIYSEGKPALQAVFEVLEYGKGPGRKVDAAKLQRALGNSDSAKRLNESVPLLEAFTKKYEAQLGDETTAALNDIVSQFKSLRAVADDRKIVTGARFAQGPSSPQLARSESTFNKYGLDKEVFANPQSAIQSASDFAVQTSKSLFGKPVAQLSDTERRQVTKMLLWRRANKDATMTQEQEAFSKILNGGTK